MKCILKSLHRITRLLCFLLQDGNETNLHTVTDPQLIGKLIDEAKFDPNARNSNGETPLHSQAKQNRYECAIELIIYGADVNMTEEVSSTSLKIGKCT